MAVKKIKSRRRGYVMNANHAKRCDCENFFYAYDGLGGEWVIAEAVRAQHFALESTIETHRRSVIAVICRATIIVVQAVVCARRAAFINREIRAISYEMKPEAL
jgi:hypothetical protein